MPPGDVNLGRGEAVTERHEREAATAEQSGSGSSDVARAKEFASSSVNSLGSSSVVYLRSPRIPGGVCFQARSIPKGVGGGFFFFGGGGGGAAVVSQSSKKSWSDG